MSKSLAISHQTKTNPNKTKTAMQSQNTACLRWREGVTAPDKYHMPKQLAPPKLLEETVKTKTNKKKKQNTWVGCKVGVCLQQGLWLRVQL